MSQPVKIVHVTPHLGGGVGKALSTLAPAQASAGVEHSFILLEKPVKDHFLKFLEARGCEILVEPPAARARERLSAADIVELEWWSHPATFKFLARTSLPSMRLLIWCHVSGAGGPIIPASIMESAAGFLFTSPCSFENHQVAALSPEARARLGVVSSATGLKNPRPREKNPGKRPRTGYAGSLNFSKMHPDYADFIARMPDLTVRMLGDPQNRGVLEDESRKAGRPGMLGFGGYIADIGLEFSRMDILAYILNPEHYGTAENALIEAMSAGVVPIVLDNPAEMAIVEDGKTGLVVESPDSFARAWKRLAENPGELAEMSENAARYAARNFSPEKMGRDMLDVYRGVLDEEKKSIDFTRILGAGPASWFLFCQKYGENFEANLEMLAQDHFSKYGLFESTKGSLFHFLTYFPDDPKLKKWAAVASKKR